MRMLRAMLAAWLGFAGESTFGAEAPPRPNVVAILVDDMGWADVGWHGSEIKTPNIDRLAAEGAKLEQFYVQPLCSPTRAAFMTGRYPMRYGLQVGVVKPWAQYGLPLGERTLAQALKEAGYETAITGKWHLGHFRPEYLPTRRGFDHQYGHYNGALDYNTHFRDGGFDWHRDDKVNHDEGYSTHLIAREAARLIAEHDPAKPLFLYVPFNAVHAPHQVPKQYKEPYAALPEPRRTYAGMLAAVDEAVGRIATAVKDAGIAENTLILLSSDNGGADPGVVTSNRPLNGGKGGLRDGGVRVAAFAHWPARIKPGTVVHAPLHVVDWFPTLLKLAGGSIEQPLPIDGRDAWPAIAEGAASPHDAILLNAAPDRGAIRMGDWKLIVRTDPRSAAARKAARKNAGGLAPVELYHISDDPNETTNLADKMPDRVAELRARYDALAAQAVPPRSAPRAADFRAPRVWGEPD